MQEATGRIEELSRQLNETRKLVRTVFEAMPLGLIIVSDGGAIEATNPFCLLMFNCDFSDLVDLNIKDLFVCPQNPELLQSLTRANPKEKYEVMALKNDGEGFPAEISLRPFTADVSLKFLIVVEDITARHEMERMKQEFISMISHDLRSPLTSIQCFLNTVSAGLFDDKMPQLKEKTSHAEEETTRLINMINSLLDIDKMEAGRLELFIDVVPCRDLIRSALQSVEALAQKRAVRLQADDPPREIHVSADTDMVVRVLVNLLSNAIKFSPADEEVVIKVSVADSFVTLSVTDHGPGIPEHFRQRMFNRFEQAAISDARVKGGTGLGLAISRAIVEQHKGTIGVNSKEGSGSTFWFTLPRVQI
jgi:PAS domain S-box-containing protein